MSTRLLKVMATPNDFLFKRLSLTKYEASYNRLENYWCKTMPCSHLNRHELCKFEGPNLNLFTKTNRVLTKQGTSGKSWPRKLRPCCRGWGGPARRCSSGRRRRRTSCSWKRRSDVSSSKLKMWNVKAKIECPELYKTSNQLSICIHYQR